MRRSDGVSPGVLGPGLLPFAALLITVPKAARASCLLGGGIRNDISTDDCLEARKTGCVRHLLTPDQYRSCLAAQKTAAHCILSGVLRDDLSQLDCDEARATGCVRRLLTPVQYEACLDAQPH